MKSRRIPNATYTCVAKDGAVFNVAASSEDAIEDIKEIGREKFKTKIVRVLHERRWRPWERSQ